MQVLGLKINNANIKTSLSNSTTMSH